jgi:Heparinase II/III-like protein
VIEFDQLSVREPSSQSVALSASGFHLLADAASAQQLVVDAGPQGAATAGHGHADSLGVVVNSGGKPLLIDPGTFEYVGPSGERDNFRGTAAHNTLTVDRQDQADAKGPFAWTNLPTCKAEKWITGEYFDLFVGSHDGYARLPHIVLHRRWIFGLKSRFWLVRDLALGSGHHRLDLNWHLAPELNTSDGDTVFRFADGNEGITIVSNDLAGWSRELVPGFWSPSYGRKQPCSVLNFSTVAQLPAEFVTLLVPLTSEMSAVGKLVSLDVSADSHLSSGYRYQATDEEHTFAFARAGSRWTLGAWSSDAEFLYLGHTPDSPYRLIFCNGTYFEVEGQRVVSCKQAVTRCEMMEVGGRADVRSSDVAAVTVHSSLNRALIEAEVSMLANSLRESHRT